MMDKYLYIKQLFENMQDQNQALSMAQYMKNKFVFYGIPTPQRRKLYKDFLKQEKKHKQIDWDFLDLCYQDSHREFQYFVCDYLKMFQNQLYTFFCQRRKYHLVVTHKRFKRMAKRVKSTGSHYPFWTTVSHRWILNN